MRTWKKYLILAAMILSSASVVAYVIILRNRGVVTVQTVRVVKQDLTQSVAANGEIKPKKYVNISSNTMGRIIEMPLKEGDHVRAGDLLIRLESVQTQAEVRSAEAALEAAQAELEGADALIRSFQAAASSARAEAARAEADLKRSEQNLNRAERMNNDGLISREQFERTKTDFEISNATLSAGQARFAQSEAQAAQALKQREGLVARISQARAALVRARDQLSKTTIVSPLEGIITQLPVNVGEIAIVGVQNQPGTVLMTIGDMSVITAEVKVDETDIVNVKVGQVARVRVDALGDRELVGTVSEIGNSAITKTSGISNTAANVQEAKDFKVVVTLDSPPPDLRPGLSSTATIVTATRDNVLTIPIQAVTIREEESALEARSTNRRGGGIEKEGVFVVDNGVARFREVKTGIVGTTDLELLEGLSEGEEIVIGPYQVLRTLQSNGSVKVQNSQ